MRDYTNMTTAMQYVLMCWSRSCDGHGLWVSFETAPDKLEALAAKFRENYGTALPPEKRRWRQHKGLPLAWACSMPVLHAPGKTHVYLLAQRTALQMPPDSPFRREAWIDRPPEVTDLFVIAKLPTQDRSLRWTWRIQNRQIALMEQHLTALVTTSEDGEIRECTQRWVSLYPMYFGVRQQIRRMFKSAGKLYCAKRKRPWPGPDPEGLPIISGFRAQE